MPSYYTWKNFFFNLSVIMRIVIRRRIANAGSGDGYWFVIFVSREVAVVVLASVLAPVLAIL